MKRKYFLCLLLFLFCGIICVSLNFYCSQNKSFAFVKNEFQKNIEYCKRRKSEEETFSNKTSRSYIFNISGKIFKFQENEIVNYKKLTKSQKEILLNGSQAVKVKELIKMGFSKKEAINYIFPETIYIEQKLTKSLGREEKEDSIKVFKNECKIKIEKGEEGYFLNTQNFYNELYEKLIQDVRQIKMSLELSPYKKKNIEKEDFVEKSSFTTNFETSSPERKNNIKVALAGFDGVILEEGEILSFNSVTGERNEKNGYKQAKIISGGTFVSGYGGGVCQVSTTLYNACLLAGLEIIEVHSHSLPVSYVEPSFDAMVSIGSSDLVFRNNSGGKIIITTSSKGDKCRVKIFGKKNKHKITRTSEKLKIIPAKEDRVEKDYKKYNLPDLEIGEEKRLSYPKDGFYSNGYLNFYDEKGNLVKTEKIRTSKYNPTEGVVVKREN